MAQQYETLDDRLYHERAIICYMPGIASEGSKRWRGWQFRHYPCAYQL